MARILRYTKLLAISAACIGVVLALYLQMAVPAGHAVVTPPVPVGGSVDLSLWNFQRDGSVSLSGQWKFFDKTWASELAAPDAPEGHNAAVPGPWPVTEKSSAAPRMDGYGTYVLKLKLPAARDGEAFAIDTGYVLSAYRVYANGQLIVESGIPSATAAGEYARAYAQVATVPSDGREVELRFEVSNHVNRYGGSFIGPTIGLKAPLTAHLDFIRALSMFLVGAMAFAAPGCPEISALGARLLHRSGRLDFGWRRGHRRVRDENLRVCHADRDCLSDPGHRSRGC